MTKTAKKKGSYRKYISIMWLLALLPPAAIIILVAAVNAEKFGKLPTFEELENQKSALASEVISSDNVILGKYYIQNRSNIHFKELADNTVKALEATEDVRFYQHSGVDLRGLARVFFKTVILQQQSSGGGSTITQQLAKNLFPRENESGLKLVIRKIKEWIIAVRLERNYTKPEIMAMYLNTVEFGHNSFGIKSAAKTFFNKIPSQLHTEESAMLIGMLQAPSRYSPVRNPENAKNRRNTVLSQMSKYNFITQSAYDSLSKLPIKLNFKAEDHNEGLAPYFRETLRLELTKWCSEHKKADGSTYNLYRDGLRIYTTIDSRMQEYAEEALKEHLTALQKTFDEHWKGRVPWAQHPEVIEEGIKRSARYASLKADGLSEAEIKENFNTKIPMTVFSWHGDIDTVMSPLDSLKYYKRFLQSGVMSMEPQTGFVRAWVGGNNYRFFKYDHVKAGRRQVGSTFKPFLYTLAMQEGYSPCFKVPNVKVSIPIPGQPDWTPSNSDGKYGGMLTLKEALAESVNVISAYLMKEFGPSAVIQIARKMGITSPIDEVPSICLGTPDVSLFEMCGAYCTFANKGVWTEPIYITRIEDKNGLVLQEFVPRKVEAISEETAYLMIKLMQGVVEKGTGARLRFRYGLNNPIAGKTGTTQNQSDGWFMGITPNLVTGVWTGCEDRSVHFRTTYLGQGANTALPLWAIYMKKLYADKDLNIYQGDFEKPEHPVSIETDCSKYEQNQQQKSNTGFGSDL
ncbi:MAG TPA: PBP1A family penicillin-binding protein [Bacteroidia bacterium]|nr:PBP1A family penicillin-binding protein [Bacteroidia bacterium]HNR49321.1 PBP1A family penicillin-binding protein [Bacteroidia bacterium]HNT83005.1 PBP1A family penicillin-binding protein [Bacteroidia bacterium]